MSEERTIKIRQVMQEFNLGLDTIVEFLQKKGSSVDRSPVAKLTQEELDMLRKEYSSSAQEKKEASGISLGHKHNEKIVIEGDAHKERRKLPGDDLDEPLFRRQVPGLNTPKPPVTPPPPVSPPPVKAPEAKVVVPPPAPVPAPPKPEEPAVKPEPVAETPKEVKKPEEPATPEVIRAESQVQGLKVLGKIDLSEKKKPSKEPASGKKAVAKTPVKEEVKEEVAKVPEKETPAEAVVSAPAEVSKPEPVAETPPPVEKATISEPVEQAPDEVIKAGADQLKGLTVLGKIDLKAFEAKPKTSISEGEKRKRKRLKTGPVQVGGSTGAVQNRDFQKGGDASQQKGPHTGQTPRPDGQKPAQGQQGQRDGFRGQGRGNQPATGNRQGAGRPGDNKPGFSSREIAGNIRATMSRGGGRGQKKKSRDKSDRQNFDNQEVSKVLKLTEFVSVADLASLMDVPVQQVIMTCMNLGMFVSINQRLDAEALTIIADEFGFEATFPSEEEEVVEEIPDAEEDLTGRAPIVTIMGHVDHGKTSLLDYIRKTKVVASEAGGITQHIGAYDVMTESGRSITFLDTPGHEAFTAMRARGAKVTDVVIIVVAADDAVMPQTKEAINHAQVAGVPIVIAINKIDKPAANPEKIKEELAQINILVEDWGGKYQCQEISAKKGNGVEDLLEKVILESDILELKANPNRLAQGTIIEASLDKGRGYVATVLVQTGTLKVGDFMLCGSIYGKVKAMYDDTGSRIESAGPSTPVQVLGLNNAPQAGDKFNVMENEREAKELANKREQIQREQSIRTKKHITIDEIGRRIALGTFKELNLIIKGDVDGSVEALADSLLKLSTDEVAVRILHKAVGQISEADVMLASASDAIIIGFQVRPSAQARRQAENEEIEIKLYSIIYDAINDIKDAMEGMLAPKVEEVIVGNVDIREVFKISKVGNVAGCYVTEGYIKRNNGIRVIRDGIVIHTGALEALKRFKDDVSEVKFGYECGLKIKNFNDIQVGDTIESFEERETKRSL